MLADFLAYVWPALPMFFFAGLCFLLAGALWLFVIRRHELSLGQADAPTYVEPATVPIPRPPHAHAARDTEVIAMIPGATPDQVIAQERWINAIDDTITELGAFELAAVEGLRVIPSAELWPEAGPVCNVCGGPLGACACHIKSAPEETQVVDLCPLTTHEFAATPDDAPPIYRQVAGRQATQELSGSLARAKEQAA